MSVEQIRVANEISDHLAETLKHQAKMLLGMEIEVATVNVYYAEGVSQDEAEKLAAGLLTDPLTQTADLEPRQDWEDPRRVEKAYKPGVMNPVTESLEKGARLLGVTPAAVDTAVEYRFPDSMPQEMVDRVMSELVINKTVERIRDRAPETLVVKGEVGPVDTIPLCDLDDNQLTELSKKHQLFLTAEELRPIQEYFKREGREPTDCELETFAAWWSEHCGHKTFNAKLMVDGQEKDPLYRRIKDVSRMYFDDEIISAFHDNAGVFRFYDGTCINIKLETHNSPSALEPYGGAMTGSGGVFRDIMGTGLGAKTILSIDIFCFAPADLPKGELPPGCLDPAYLQQRVIDGVRDYGNRMGIPTANGSIHYHDNFRAKPTVMVGAVGIMPEEFALKRYPKPGDLAVTIGGRTGRDGIHGATFSSGSMTAETVTVSSSSVQIGNAIEEKKLSDALLEARDAGLISALTDCGAAGFCSAVGEMGQEIGVQVDLARAPLKYEGLAPWEIWLSESQERMVAAISPDDYQAFEDICRKHGVESAALGTFGTPEGSPRLQITYGEQQVADLDYDFLKNGLPQREMMAAWRAPDITEHVPQLDDWDNTLLKVMGHGNICSKEPVVRQYDHEVQGATVMKPYGGVHLDAPNDAVVLTPILGKPYGLVEAHGMNPVLNDINPYDGSVWAFAEGLSNYVAAGGDPDKAVYVNNYVTATPDEHVMGALDKMVDAVTDCMHATKRPIISGKDSLSSRYKQPDGTFIDVPPVLTITVAGKIPDIAKTVSTDIKQPGSILVMVGKADFASMGGSTLYEVLGGSSAEVPKVDLNQLPQTMHGMHEAIQSGQVLSCHDVSEGGLAAAVAEMCFGGDCGAHLILAEQLPSEQQLFNETAGCFVVEVRDEQTAEKLFADLPYRVIGQSTPEKAIKAVQNGTVLLDSGLSKLKAAWKQPLQKVLV